MSNFLLRNFRGVNGVLAIACLELAIVAMHAPRINGMRRHIQSWDAVLNLTNANEYAMDQKGELIFRRRPFFYALERVTLSRIRHHLLTDDIPEQLVRTDTQVVGLGTERMSKRDRAFIQDNYLSVGPIRVAGMFLHLIQGHDSSIQFETQIPAAYKFVTPTGSAAGSLDGQLVQSARYLHAGFHRYTPAPGETHIALILAKALDQGYEPFEKNRDSTGQE